VETSAIHIRRLTLADAAIYRAIRLESLCSEPESFGSTIEVENSRPLRWFADRLAGAEVFGAFRGTELLGVAGLLPQSAPKETHKAILWGMYVRAAARKFGVGRSLVEAVIAAARRNHAELLQLRVVDGNSAAQRLYASLGFAAYGIEKRALKQGGKYWDEILMALDLCGPEEGNEQE
jgi:GNAT superfamily N-acetyltransferase